MKLVFGERPEWLRQVVRDVDQPMSMRVSFLHSDILRLNVNTININYILFNHSTVSANHSASFAGRLVLNTIVQ